MMYVSTAELNLHSWPNSLKDNLTTYASSRRGIEMRKAGADGQDLQTTRLSQVRKKNNYIPLIHIQVLLIQLA